VQTKLKLIEGGAKDCDGYTSDKDEAHFIDTLLSEIPDLYQQLEKSLT
jgi:hypothetical protein